MSTPELSLPDQNPHPDWMEVCWHAESLLREYITRDDHDDEHEKYLIYSIAEQALQALYGPSVSDLIAELRERHGPQD